MEEKEFLAVEELTTVTIILEGKIVGILAGEGEEVIRGTTGRAGKGKVKRTYRIFNTKNEFDFNFTHKI